MPRVPSEAGVRTLRPLTQRATWIPIVRACLASLCACCPAQSCAPQQGATDAVTETPLPRLCRPAGILVPLPRVPHINSASSSAEDIKHSHAKYPRPRQANAGTSDFIR